MNIKDKKLRKYFRYRDFELVQPLYDFGFMLELASHIDPQGASPYRIKALNEVALRMDSYSSSICEWLEGGDDSIYFQPPSLRIEKYLKEIMETGSIQELSQLTAQYGNTPLRLRAFPKSSAKNIAKEINSSGVNTSVDISGWCSCVHINDIECRDFLSGKKYGTWQAPHIIPPLLRFLNKLENQLPKESQWKICNIRDGVSPIQKSFNVEFLLEDKSLFIDYVDKALENEPFFQVKSVMDSGIVLQHRMGWFFELMAVREGTRFKTIRKLILSYDPLAKSISKGIKGDLHCHSFWSDGISTPQEMVNKSKALKLDYIAITDHSRSSHLQNGLTPSDWLRQANSISAEGLRNKILHGIEVDILSNGTLDLPDSLLQRMDIVIGSLHSGLKSNRESNTDRILKAIESGNIDIIAHPTTALVGKPGIPCFERKGIDVDWSEIIPCCAKWHVALEINCFPSRFDLSGDLLKFAISEGCWISLGTDAHSAYHLNTLPFGEKIIKKHANIKLLNSLSYEEVRNRIKEARIIRQGLTQEYCIKEQPDFLDMLFPEKIDKHFNVRIAPRPPLPYGGKIVGMDLAAAKGKATGVALLNEDNSVETTMIMSNNELIEYVVLHQPDFVSIDSPLGYPGGKDSIDPQAGIVRVAEHDLSSIGIPAYPALIESMVKLTTRGVLLKNELEQLAFRPKVIESYPGAAQDVLGIPRKQRGLELLRNGLKRLGIRGSGLNTEIHDELDAITSAIVGRYYEIGKFEGMGVPEEAQLIVPIVEPINFDNPPVIYMCGRTGAGKSTVSRYLAMFYGFKWIKTAGIIRELLLRDYDEIATKRLKIKCPLDENINIDNIKDFGEIILNEYDQRPMKEYLENIIRNRKTPLVIDSIRSWDDVEEELLVCPDSTVWCISCDDASLMQHREKRMPRKSVDSQKYIVIDKYSHDLQQKSNTDIVNNESLERLRQKVDDALFESFIFSDK